MEGVEGVMEEVSFIEVRNKKRIMDFKSIMALLSELKQSVPGFGKP